MAAYGLVENATGKIKLWTNDIDLANSNLQEGQNIVEFNVSNFNDLECKKWINGELVDDQEELDFVKSLQYREERDDLLKELDLIIANPIRYNELSDDKKAEYAQYRTDLLNVPQQSGFPHNINWPTKPE